MVHATQISEQSTVFSGRKTLLIRDNLVHFSSPKVMGIINVTPDSFYKGSRVEDEKELLGQAGKMLEEGAVFLDVGGYSTRPGALEVPEKEEIQRSVWAIQVLLRHFPQAWISIDTFRSAVARACVDAGAVMVNDVSGGSLDERLFATVANLGVPYILMHMRGNPQTMQALTHYDDLVKDVIDYFHLRVEKLKSLGVKDILLDPGFGFAKTVAQNFYLLEKLEAFHVFELPLMVGLSRKSMIWKTLSSHAEEALNGTTALHAVAVLKGVQLIRTHDVREAVEVVTLLEKMKCNRE